jgi:hypothetical protein
VRIINNPASCVSSRTVDSLLLPLAKACAQSAVS